MFNGLFNKINFSGHLKNSRTPRKGASWDKAFAAGGWFLTNLSSIHISAVTETCSQTDIQNIRDIQNYKYDKKRQTSWSVILIFLIEILSKF
jgi:hypothetical protein